LKKLFINFIKGVFIGVGAVLPGLSGGVLASVFGVYEPIINFASNLKKDFLANVKFFTPILCGGLFGVFLLSFALSYFLEYHLAEVSIFFVGAMMGVFPALVKKAGAKGREPVHLLITVAVAIGAFLIFSKIFGTTPPPSLSAIGVGTWITSGAIIGLGITFPGLSPSNFLLYLGLYQPFNLAISQLSLSVLIPVAFGGLLAVILTSKLVTYLLKVAYTVVYHIILGLVLTSTVMILPRDFSSPWVIGMCLLAGLTVGSLMCRLEHKL